MRTRTSCLAMAVVLIAPVALASNQPLGLASAATETAQPAATSSNPNEVICKNADAETGSTLLHRKICMTRTEWQQMQNNNRAEITDLQQRSLATAPHQ